MEVLKMNHHGDKENTVNFDLAPIGKQIKNNKLTRGSVRYLTNAIHSHNYHTSNENCMALFYYWVVSDYPKKEKKYIILLSTLRR